MANFLSTTVKIPITGASQHTGAYAADDLFFDWVEFEIPSGGARLMAVSGYVKSTLDAGQTIEHDDFSLLFSNNATAGSIAAENAIAGYEKFPNDIIGSMEVTSGDYIGHTTNGRMYTYFTADAHTKALAFNSNVNVSSTTGYDKFYVAGIANDTIDFTSDFQINDADIDASSPGTALVLSGTSMDAAEHFRAGDVLVAHDNAAIGTIASVTDANNIVLTESISTGVLEHNDYVYLKHPLVLTFHFELP